MISPILILSYINDFTLLFWGSLDQDYVFFLPCAVEMHYIAIQHYLMCIKKMYSSYSSILEKKQKVDNQTICALLVF